MAFDNLDAQDKAICEALAAGKSDDEVMQEFGVEADKVTQLRSVVGEGASQPSTETTEPAPEGESTEGAQPEGEATAPSEGEATGQVAEGEQA